jgi:AraC family transcriptional regulator
VPERNPQVHLGSPRFTTAEYGGFLVTDVSFPGRLVLPAHQHDRTVLAVTLRGRWDSVLGARRAESTAGYVLTEPACARHSNHFSTEGARVLVLQPDMARAEELFTRTTLLSEIHHFGSEETLGLAKRLQIEVNHRDSLSPLAIEGLSLEIMATASRSHEARAWRERSPKWMARALEYAHAHYRGAPCVAEMAAAAGVHPAHLARGFRRELGIGVATYVRQLRIQWAAVQLTSTRDSIADIAMAAGFVDQSHFTRLFRRCHGLTPAEFRRRDMENRRSVKPRSSP